LEYSRFFVAFIATTHQMPNARINQREANATQDTSKVDEKHSIEASG
jgi:hypothetical protein